MNSEAAREGIGFLADGVRDGWIAKKALTYKEEESKQAFQDGHLLFLRNWPYAYVGASGKGSAVAGKVGAVPLPGTPRPGHEARRAAPTWPSTHMRGTPIRPRARSLTSRPSGRSARSSPGGAAAGSAALYQDPELIRAFPYLPTLRASILAAAPRPRARATTRSAWSFRPWSTMRYHGARDAVRGGTAAGARAGGHRAASTPAVPCRHSAKLLLGNGASHLWISCPKPAYNGPTPRSMPG